jgi:TonB family protein
LKTFIFSLFFLFVIANTGFSQTTDSLEEILVAEDEAEFPGGYPALMKYIYGNMVYPQVALEKNIQGKVIIRCMIDSSGKVENVSVFRGIPECGFCDQEAVRLVSNMPNWVPLEIDGHKKSTS